MVLPWLQKPDVLLACYAAVCYAAVCYAVVEAGHRPHKHGIWVVYHYLVWTVPDHECACFVQAADVKQLAANSLEAAAASAEPDLQEHHSSTTYGTKQGTTCAPSEGPGGWTQLYNQFGFLDTDQEANRIPVPAFCNEVMPAAQSQYGVEQQLFGTSAIPAPSCSMLFQPSLASHNVSSSSHMLELQHPPMAHCIYNNELFSPVKQPQPAGQCRGVLGGDGLATASFDAFSAHSSWFGTGWGSKPLFGSECQHNCSVMGQVRHADTCNTPQAGKLSNPV